MKRAPSPPNQRLKVTSATLKEPLCLCARVVPSLRRTALLAPVGESLAP
jgi:hypothetical protein